MQDDAVGVTECIYDVIIIGNVSIVITQNSVSDPYKSLQVNQWINP